MATFKIQKSSSTVNWTGKKVLGLHTGMIGISEGYVEVKDDQIAAGEIIIDMTSIVVTDIEDSKTHKEFRDHLLHEDFFAVDKFKTAKLVVTTAAQIGRNKYRVEGVLTVKDISHPVSFITTTEIFTDYLHALGEITIDRTWYNIRYGSGKFISNLGDKLIYDDFVLQFKLIGQTSIQSQLS